MSATDTTSVSPQRQHKCVCPSWTTARECYRIRYGDGPDVWTEDACECACHEADDEDRA